ncbi:MAG: filamentous hemagglutinin N-terminal domain-containing protein [Hassallia sp. WJT32-NPBG1]|jgi:filamentous hemagglutinin family protein|nr:filamentous hemagglutinin N-terminal domain-containing protein [Hassallia sp. WJT32-NPBG1]
MGMGRKQGCDRLSWVVVLGLAGALNASANVQAQQVVPDTSLPVNSAVTVNGNNFTINGGTQAGVNLFHSFSEFSIPTNGSAFFNNPQTIQNIISRVTGSSVSDIQGMLGANGTANLFLLNPNGIVFGPNASLNVGGSFVGTTANAIQFGNQGFFSASNPNNPALLTVNPSALFFNQIAAASNPNISTTATNLSVLNGRGLFLVGGNININRGRLNAFGGRVELGGLAEVGTVGLNLSGNDLSLSFPDAVTRGNVSLINGAVVDVSGGNGGSIAINAAKVTVSDGANLVAHTFGEGNAGSIAIAASDDISISGNNTALGSQVFPLAVGNGGTITLNAPIVGISDNAALIADSQGRGNGSKIAINAAKVTVSNGANLAANTFGEGNAGSIAITANDNISINGINTTLGSQVLADATGNGGTITLNAPKVMVSGGANLIANTFGEGNAGSIAIAASDNISVNGNGTTLGSSQSLKDATGNGGTINLDAPKVMVSNGANLIAHTFGQGNAGSIAITASDDISINGNNTALSSQVFPDAMGNGGTITLNAPIVRISDNAAIIADSQGRGNGSTITLNAAKVTVSDGASMTANTFGQGSAGSIAIAASDDISINGNNTALSSQVFPLAVGNGGTITLNAPIVRISDSAALIADSQGRGNGSTITLNAAKVTVSDGANLAANTFGQGNAGSIAITATDDISIDGRNTALGSQVFGDATGNGGTINLNAPKVTVSGGADIVANTEAQGNAGSITIDAANSLLIDGQGTGLGSQVFGDATGNGGTINLNAARVTVSGGADIVANTEAQGNAGAITIDAANSLLIDGEGTGVGTQVLADATGKGGTINLNAPTVTISDGGALIANTEAQGNAGTITIDAANSLLIDGQGTGLGTQVLGNATGKGGTINLNAPTVTVSGGADIVANTEAQGNAGTITVNAKQVFLDGQASDKEPHGIGSAVFGSASGNGGQIVINTGLLNLTNNAQLIVSSVGQGTAGEIKIDSGSIRLDNQSAIRATTAFGNGGNITLRAKDLLLLRRRSQISTTAGDDRAGGDGGNITINTPFLIAVPNENSDISANAFSGRGGKVDITATGVYGIESRPQPTLQSDITASSQLGVAGVVLINTPDVDPSRGLIILPTLVVNSPELLAPECNSFIGKEGSSFTVTGRGGLPPSPDDFLSGDVVWSDTRNLAQASSVSNLTLEPASHRASTSAKVPPKTTERIAIIPATGWVFNGKGEVTLISDSSTTERFGSSSDTCLKR